MKTTIITRAFLYNGVELTDINPLLSENSVLQHYSAVYPELTNASIVNKGLVNNDKIMYEFKTNVGTKG
jgi:PRTRC genetic system protein C